MSDFWEMLGDFADTVGKAEEVRDDACGVVGRTIVLAEKVGDAKDLHDRMKKLSEEKKKPSTARFVFELGSHFLGRRR